MEKILIKNGLVFDPINNIVGEKKDILIENGKIVENFSNESNIKEINANGKTVIPSGIDIHTHIASQQIQWIRLLGSNNQEFKEIWKNFSLEHIAKSYISNGYTFIVEANVFPSLAKETIFNFKNLPILDKAMLINVSNIWALELEYQRGKIEDMAIFLSDLLKKIKGFGIKIYNPFESEAWNFNEMRENISNSGRLYNFTGLDVYENLIKCSEYLNLPHSAHAHIEGYETNKAKENLFLILEKLKELKLDYNKGYNSNKDRNQILHLAHASMYNIDGDNDYLIKTVNESKLIDLDLGFLSFNSINPLITSDRRVINQELTKNNEFKKILIRSAIEFEGDAFAMLRHFNKNNKLQCILWANAIDLALKIKNKWQVQLSLNYPNYGDINDIPKIATWLVSTDAREKFIKEMNPNFLLETSIKDNNEVLSFNDFVIITRAGPAKSLGLGNIKGNLGFEADGDLNIIDIDISNVDISKDYENFKNALKKMEYVIKEGEIVKKNDKINLKSHGRIFWSQGNVVKENREFILSKKKEFYKRYYSIFYDSLTINVEEKFLRKIE
ncbi:MAG: amidohydrolase family protein [Promethearchaeota archaeon]